MKRAIFNQKGGVGKTSLTCNIAAAMADMGRKVLVVDLDSQANSSQYLLGTRYANITETIADFFSSTLSFHLFRNSLAKTIIDTPFSGLSIVPADSRLKELQPKLEGRYKIFKLREAIDTIIDESHYDEVLFDTPPALNFYSMSSLMAADSVLVPFDCDAFSAEAISQVSDAVKEVSLDHCPNLKIEGIVINQFQGSARLPTQSIEQLKDEGYPIITPYISSSIVMRESHSASKPLVYFKPKHKVSHEFNELANKLLNDQNKHHHSSPPAHKKSPTKGRRKIQQTKRAEL